MPMNQEVFHVGWQENKLFLAWCELWGFSLCYFCLIISPSLGSFHKHALICIQLKTQEPLIFSGAVSWLIFLFSGFLSWELQPLQPPILQLSLFNIRKLQVSASLLFSCVVAGKLPPSSKLRQLLGSPFMFPFSQVSLSSWLMTNI